MAFTTPVGRTRIEPVPKVQPMGAGRFLATVAILFGLFCAFDYSPYGTGVVSDGLHVAQREFQGFVYSFRLRM